MNILPKKSWHVRNKDNVARVRKDEAQAAEEEREAKRRVERAEQEARTEYLRNKSRAALSSAGETKADEDEAVPSGGSGILEHLNLFPLEDSSEKKGNVEYLKDKKDEQEKQERAIGLLVSLGPQPGTEVTPCSIERLRAERLQREAEERRRTQALLDQRNGKRKEPGRETMEREMPYNSAYFPELARKRQRRDRDSWRDEILKS
ncbi:Leukocyte receptor cluster member 1 like [Dissostichus eleginoides]|uniref:Leukocyte receptor cluster member 1 like n=1 Tax=Dissostichus eleginoides TaxID=100907 RepID=A0AAD9FC86_DISEL|nr:Leukocyte receptor cluster member 1 like [Dissostichus eleginoides]